MEEPPVRAADFSRAAWSLAQLDDPWIPIDDADYMVIRWRLLFPLVWHYLQLPPWLYLAMPHLGCLLVCWLVAWIAHQSLGNWLQTWMATVIFAALPWFFVSTGWLAYFDSWLVAGLLAAVFIPSRYVLGSVCLVVPWIDERFVFALPITMMARAVALWRIEQKQWRSTLLDAAVVILASIPYPTVRAIAWLTGDAQTTSYVQSHWQQIWNVSWRRYARGLWSGYRVAWSMFAAAMWFVGARLGWKWGAAFAFMVIASSIGCLFIAGDMSRSLMIVSPVCLLGVLAWKECWPSTLALALPLVMTGNLLLPAWHVVWTWPASLPIESLPTEIWSWRNPPRFMQAGELANQGKALFDEGKLVEAREKYDEAIQLDDTIALHYLRRALINMRLNDRGYAAADIEKVLRLDPLYPDALCLRARLRKEQGIKSPSTAEDLRNALRIAPANWAMREEAEQLLVYFTEDAKPTSTRPAAR
ncbi:MAG TPA: tetratricopeptide repeat protein [Pirellulales bacterium]|nr:tetratricopeptide repeat protein [Pirellulales bacterium]